MEYVIGILLLISFFGLAFYCIKGHNLMIGFLVMAALWTILPLVGYQFAGAAFQEANAELFTSTTLVAKINAIFQSAPEGWGTTLVNVLWGAWFGRVLMETGVAATIIRKTVELGGDRPMVVITLLNIVTAAIFTAMTGAGPVIAIGVIVLPILMSLGIPKAIALFTYMGSVAAGIYINPVNFTQYRAFFPFTDDMGWFDLSWYTFRWGIWALLIMLVITTILTGIYLKKSKTSHAWAAATEKPVENANAPLPSLITPLIPVLGALFLKTSVILGFVVGGFYALLLCGKLKGFKASCQLVNKMYYDGVVDTASLIGFLLTLPMFNKAAELCAPFFRVVIGGIIPSSPLVLCIVFAVIAGLGLFRGPMTLVGCGAATLGVLLGMNSFNLVFLYACFAIPTITMNIGTCITQSWVAWGLAYTKVESRDFLKRSIPNGYITSILLYVLTFVVFGSFTGI